MLWITVNGAAACAGGIVLLAVTIVLAVVAGRLLGYRSGTERRFEAERFSLARYEAMTRLAGEDDLEFLASLPGYRRETGARLRRERRRILRMYLRDLARDFHHLHAAARKMAADAPEHNSALVGLLIRYQLTFWRHMALIELRLLAPAARLPRFDIAPLLRPMELMQFYVSEA